MEPILFVRVGWMKEYRGPQPDDIRPIGGGKHNKESLGHEAFNFLDLDGRMRAHCMPVLRPREIREKKPGSVKLERIQPGFKGNALEGVLVVFVATRPELGGQFVVGWFRNATVFRHERKSPPGERNGFNYSIEGRSRDAVPVPEPQRSFAIPRGMGALGEANVCYPLEPGGDAKDAGWMKDTLRYINSYGLENIAHAPESEHDDEVAQVLSSAIERAAGLQSNPQIRKAIEKYAMD